VEILSEYTNINEQKETIIKGNTNIAICFGARGSLGAFSNLEGPARRVSLK
jgi:hypothetical protein